MRAKSTLALICLLLGSTVVAQQVEAATAANTRNTQKYTRAGATPAQATVPVRPTVQARANKPDRAALTRNSALPPPPPPAPSLAQARNARSAIPVASARTSPAAAPARRDAMITPVALPSISRPAHAASLGVGTGTPLLHVAQEFGLSCVPFVRMATGMNISGNGGVWWHNAAGSYARGQQPERGAVLSFPGSGGMNRGHVAVVSRVVNSRTIQVDHANWGGPGLRRGQVLRGAVVVDVSDRNDWTAVRHQVGFDSTTFGRTYPTHGFIYNRSVSGGAVVAQAGRFEEVADMTSPHAAQHLRLTSEMLRR